MTPRLLERYKSEIRPGLMQELGISNTMRCPSLRMIVVSMGIGQVRSDKKRVEDAVRDLTVITGQKPRMCKAKKSVSNFKVREGDETGMMVTLRGRRMYEFLDRLINVAVPRIRDFRGLNPTSFDGRGNYSMGLTEQTVFPEVDADKVQFRQGMNITIVTTARNDAESRSLLKFLGMPFKEN